MPGYELIGEEEYKNIEQVFDNGAILFRHSFDSLRNGVYMVKDFETAFAKRMNSPRALAVTSGTAALRVALAALNIKSGDEVITQSFTFVATVEAIIESGATPVCCEIDDTLNMDPVDLAKKITAKTKAIIVVHMLGVPARLEEITKISKDLNIPIIEDTAWGCGGFLRDRPLGTWGEIGTFSFDFAKTMTTGEGGMLVFQNEAIADYAAAWHDHGHENNPNLPRWEDSRSSSGFNYRMMELQGAIGLAQLEKLDNVVLAQRENAIAIKSKLVDFPIKFRTIPDGAYETADALVFFVESKAVALKCREYLLKDGLGTKILPEAYSWHFAATWDHMKELKATYNCNLEDAFPKSKQIIETAVSIPITINMKDDVPDRVSQALEKAFNN